MRTRLRTPVGHDSRDRSALKSARKNDRGFSLLELCVVVAILMILGAISMISAVSVVQGIRLQESATNYANLLQQARMRAVRDNRIYTVQTTTTPPNAFFDLGLGGTNPTIVFAKGVTPMTFGSGPGLTNLENQFLPVGQEWTVNTTSPQPTFGPRGLPCKLNAGNCPSMVPASYVTFLQNSESTKWKAITVNPAARIRIWSYDGTTWSPMN